MTHWALRTLLSLPTVSVGLLVFVFAVPPVVDLTGHRDAISRYVSDMAGRDVEFGGDIELTLGSQVRLRVGSLGIDNPD